jgi:hypothetical protein
MNFSTRKIIPKSWKIAGALTLFIYVLVPTILYLGPYLSFDNYDWIPALINLIYFHYLFDLLT